ncbi:MAG: hypothetical protein Kow0059_05430 [Candidatus Sumerlaeia bacterium]
MTCSSGAPPPRPARPPEPRSAPWWTRRGVPWAILACAVVLCYANTFRNGFVYDDEPYILQNELVRRADDFWAFFTSPYPPHKPGFSLYRPLPMLLYAVNYHLGFGADPSGLPGLPPGPRPWPFHAANLTLHWLVCGLMFTLWTRLGARRAVALAAAVVFAVHPVHVENVAAMIGAVDLLAAGLGLGAVWLWWEGRNEPHYWGLRRLGAAACFLLALMSKEGAAAVVALVGAAVLVVPGAVRGAGRAQGPGGRTAIGRAVLEMLPLGAVLAFYLFARVQVIGTFGADPAIRYFKPEQTGLRWLSVPIVWLMNIRLMLWPHPLCADYNYPIRFLGEIFIPAPRSPLDVWVLAGLGAMALYAGAVTWAWRRDRLAAFGLVWFALALFPTSQMIPFQDLLGERFLYLPSVGFCYAAAAALVGLAERLGRSGSGTLGRRRMTLWGRRALWATGGIVVVALAAQTIARNRAWQSPRTFWLALQRVAPQNRDAWYGYAYALDKEREQADRRAAALVAAGRRAEGEALLAEAAALEEQAIAAYELAARRTPDYATVWLNLGNLRLNGRRPDPAEARRLFRRVIALADGRKDFLLAGWWGIGQAWIKEKRWAEALTALQNARRFGDAAELNVLLGIAHAELGDPAAAERAWRRALALDPANPNALKNLDKLHRSSPAR